MSALAEFQHNFCQALLLRGGEHAEHFGVGLRVYQNTTITGLIDALRANYSTVERLVGAQWFADAAREYARANLPTEPALALYGENFAEFLSGVDSLSNFPYVPHVAKLDRLWTEAHFAGDAGVLDATQLGAKSGDELLAMTLSLHPSARLAWLPHSAASIWLASRPPAETTELQVEDAAEGVLVVRPQGAVEVLPLSEAEYLFLCCLQQGLALGEATTTTLQAHADADIGTILARFIHACVFCETRN